MNGLFMGAPGPGFTALLSKLNQVASIKASTQRTCSLYTLELPSLGESRERKGQR